MHGARYTLTYMYMYLCSPPTTRMYLLQVPSSLPKLLNSVKWSQHKDVAVVRLPILYIHCSYTQACTCTCTCIICSLSVSLVTHYYSKSHILCTHRLSTPISSTGIPTLYPVLYPLPPPFVCSSSPCCRHGSLSLPRRHWSYWPMLTRTHMSEALLSAASITLSE